jgi:UDP-2,3-diacylglucosamine hydrolase
MIHGHTHRPARHQFDDHGTAYLRYVLPDWDCDCAAPRGGWIALDENGALSRIDVDGTRLSDSA